MRHFISILFCIASLFISSMAQASYSYFDDMSEVEHGDLSPFSKWTNVLSRFSDQREISDSECGLIQYHPCAIKKWKELIEDIKGDSLSKQIEAVNNWGNKHPYIVDQLNWGMNDYWVTPYEFMDVNGDCEDYAIAKYYSLRALGVSEDRMRIMIVQDFNLGGIIHAILGVYDEDDNLIILDNQIKRVIPALKIYHYRPIYAVNESNWWKYTPRM